MRDGNRVSNIVRTHWYLGGNAVDIYSWVRDVAGILVTPYITRAARHNGRVPDKEPICSRSVGLSADLSFERLTAAMYLATIHPPFDTVEVDLDCDISDHGLYEIELLKWNWWAVNHYELTYERPEAKYNDRTIVARFKFKPNVSIDKGINLEWNGPET